MAIEKSLILDMTWNSDDKSMIVCKFSVVDVWADARDLVPEEADQEDAVQGLQAGPREEHQEELKIWKQWKFCNDTFCIFAFMNMIHRTIKDFLVVR